MNKYMTMIVIVTGLTSGCASLEKSLLLGATLTGAVGTGIGLNVDQDGYGGALIGAAVGMLAGAAVSYLVYEDKQEKESFIRAFSTKQLDKEDFPSLRAPEASCARIDAAIQGNRYIGPHISCEIEKPAVWGR